MPAESSVSEPLAESGGPAPTRDSSLRGKVRAAGYGLTNLLRRPFFAALAPGSRVHPLACFSGSRNISIGDGTRISARAELDADGARSAIRIGARGLICPRAMLLTFGGWIELGDDCSVNPFCVLYGQGGLRIGNGVRIAAGTVIIPSNHNFDRRDVPIHRQGVSSKGIVIADDVWIGANATILDGVHIGTGGIVAAGAVVNRDVEPFTIVGGVPARLLRKRP